MFLHVSLVRVLEMFPHLFLIPAGDENVSNGTGEAGVFSVATQRALPDFTATEPALNSDSNLEIHNGLFDSVRLSISAI